jgi:molybdate transport system substrate-binding protein
VRALLLALVSLVAGGCPGDQTEPSLRVYAASSLTELVDHAAADLSDQGAVLTSFGASSAVARQVEAGAPVDVVVSANPRWIDYLEQRGLLAERRELFGNRLVLIAPAGEAPPDGLAALDTFEGRLALGDPEHVPAGIYARSSLERLGHWERLRERLSPSADVRAALLLVEQGACPLGIVYASDAAASTRVEVVATFPPESHAPIRYHGAVTQSGQLERGRRFLDALATPAWLTARGFEPLTE